jgi:hypothetical protein
VSPETRALYLDKVESLLIETNVLLSILGNTAKVETEQAAFESIMARLEKVYEMVIWIKNPVE